ncbi:MAG: hypothetical protein R3B09_18565 [Nannocystaceae bacterium]
MQTATSLDHRLDRRRRRSVAALALLLACSSDATQGPATPRARPTVSLDHVPAPEVPPPPKASPAERVAAFTPVRLDADVRALAEPERAALDALIAAARGVDPIFDRQAYAGNPELAERLAADASPEGAARLALFRIMRGPWDRQDHFEPFALDRAHPPGAGFYPEDLTAEAFRGWVAAHPGDKAAFESLTTVIERDGEGLKARPYHEVYAEWLTPVAAGLEEAARLTRDRTLQKFLRSRAVALRSDDYYQSDKDWMDLRSPVEITIGPYETYEDELLGLKGAYEAFVTVTLPAASADLERFKGRLQDMEEHLPIPDEYKTRRGRESPIRVVDLVFSAGDARKSVQTIAFNLPNDERVRAEKGAKKVLLRNLIRAKFDAIMRPIGERSLVDEHRADLSADAFFHQVLFHELSHTLGPAHVDRGGQPVELRIALGAAFSPLEEAKADVVGVYSLLYMIDEGEVPKAMRTPALVSYVAGLLRSMRFGVAEAHGRGATVQLLYFIDRKAITRDRDTGRLRVDLANLEESIRALIGEIIGLQRLGSEGRADAWMSRFSALPDELTTLMSELEDLPIDVRPVYPLAGESP